MDLVWRVRKVGGGFAFRTETLSARGWGGGAMGGGRGGFVWGIGGESNVCQGRGLDARDEIRGRFGDWTMRERDNTLTEDWNRSQDCSEKRA